MTKRVAAGLLWFYAGWCLGATIAFELDLSPALGPIFGTAFAAIVAGDPRRIIWSRGRAAPDPNSGAQEHVPA
jgi:hypothetical protein